MKRTHIFICCWVIERCQEWNVRQKLWWTRPSEFPLERQELDGKCGGFFLEKRQSSGRDGNELPHACKFEWRVRGNCLVDMIVGTRFVVNCYAIQTTIECQRKICNESIDAQIGFRWNWKQFAKASFRLYQMKQQQQNEDEGAPKIWFDQRLRLVWHL